MLLLCRVRTFGGQMLEETEGWEGASWISKLSGSVVE
jgi:hypothetical protein